MKELCNLNLLPIELISFTCNCENKKAILKWSSATETNSDFCLIERSNDAINWETIGKVKSAGNSSFLKNYSFTDEESKTSISYYRLKQIDADGRFDYSHTLSFNNCEKIENELNLYPNPGNGKLNLLFRGEANLFNSVSIYNSFGEKIYNSEKYSSTIDISDKTAGIYFLYFNVRPNVIIKKIVIK